jgi:hypothetical protein
LPPQAASDRARAKPVPAVAQRRARLFVVMSFSSGAAGARLRAV